ncbi:TPA: radical SAM protein [Candidatus Woesearchaeota archaeon]|nr:hypothetical protein QT06_C0001G0708 [archaeon GW2011_AR15]MBS3103506.1 radical SAM protein [Candidatus Woesearchaeota archaeon]HIH41624.1 radical SAM protein [Candidatus Woesearchaeota archaeon]
MFPTYVRLGYSIPAYRLSRVLNHPLAKPINITLSVTNRCYSRCRSCNVWKVHKENPEIATQEMTTEEWGKCLKSLGRGPIWFTITGGETTLRDDLPQIVSLIAKHNRPRYINLATSGIYPKKTISIVRETLKITSKNNILFTLNLSIDEIDERYEEVRGVPKGFEKVKETFFGLKELKKEFPEFVLGVNMVISRLNYKRFKEIHNYIMDKLGPDSFVSEIVERRKAIYFDDDLSIPDEDAQEILNYLIEYENQKSEQAKVIGFFRRRYYRILKKIIHDKREAMPSYSGIASCTISYNGDVWDAPKETNIFGSLRENGYDFSRVWKSDRARNERKKLRAKREYSTTANPLYTDMLCNLKI